MGPPLIGYQHIAAAHCNDVVVHAGPSRSDRRCSLWQSLYNNRGGFIRRLTTRHRRTLNRFQRCCSSNVLISYQRRAHIGVTSGSIGVSIPSSGNQPVSVKRKPGQTEIRQRADMDQKIDQTLDQHSQHTGRFFTLFQRFSIAIAEVAPFFVHFNKK